MNEYALLYRGSVLRNDIALVELSQPLTFTSNVRPICLPTDTATFNIPAQTTCVATGWGNLGTMYYHSPYTKGGLCIST